MNAFNSVSSGPDRARGAQEVVLRFENVARHFGSVIAVERVDLELRRGEILTLLGPSGCGKTTTLRMAVGLERATHGRVIYRDRVVDSPTDRIFVPPEKREMSMVFQSYAIWPHMTVFENVAFPLRVRRTDNATVKRKVEEALSLVGLSGLEARSGTQLSGGQQQRVAVARGLVSDPDILLMDEPFSNLDAKLRETMRAELKLLQRRLNISILFVTHDQSEALALSDRLAVMKDGRIEQIGAPTELYSHPATPSVRDFLGRSILLPGRIDQRVSGQPARVRLDMGGMVVAGGADHTGQGDSGAPCLVSIKPEEIGVDSSGAAPGSDQPNLLAARIKTLLFLGQHYEAAVELDGGGDMLIYLPRATNWEEGQAINLRLPPDKVQLWNAEQRS